MAAASTAARPRGRSENVSRLPGLDGLRTFAVLAVILLHTKVRAFEGGSIGVDVFFVISGFVITGVLVRERERTGTVSLTAFYLRRLLRLWPVLLLLCLVAAILGLALPHTALHHNLAELPAAAFYFMDFTRMGAAPHASYSVTLGHTWSLAVEEQFYLLWAPIFLLVVVRWRNARWLLWLTAALILAALLDRVLVWQSAAASINRIYNGPDTRADQLMVGCFLALLLHQRPAWTRRAEVRRAVHWLLPVAVVGLLFVLTQVAVNKGGSHPHLYYTVGFTLVALAAGVVVLVLATMPRHPLTRVLAWRGLSVPGWKLSYGMYIWHYPISAVLLIYLHLSPGLDAAVLIPSTFGAAFVSRVAVEDRFDAIRRRLEAVRTI